MDGYGETKELFLSWSGEESKRIAVKFKELLEYLFTPLLRGYMSAVDSPVGKRGVDDLAKKLSRCNYGICLVNQENARAPWIHYEAGAISKEAPISRLMVLLLNNDPKCLEGTPLYDFKYTLFTHDGILEIIDALIKIIGCSKDREIYIKRFEESWGKFEKECLEISKEYKDGLPQEEKNR